MEIADFVLRNWMNEHQGAECENRPGADVQLRRKRGILTTIFDSLDEVSCLLGGR